MENIHNWPLEHWHIELCSKCSLKCPRCSRQEIPEGLINQDLSLQWFKNNFTGKILSNVQKITFCGDDGDPIYSKDFIAILEWIRKNNNKVQFVIVTNGSYKTKQWWQKLVKVLDQRDHIHFSLDGWDQDSNNIYRINCDWSSIVQGINVINTSKVYLTWAAIAFKFNENKIEHMKKLAKQLKFDQFQLTLSTKFGKNYEVYPKNDPLQPSDKFIAKGRFVRLYTNLSNRTWIDLSYNTFLKRFKKTKTENQTIVPLCMIGNKGLYLNAEGKFYPCCWTGLRYSHNKNVFNYIESKKTLGEIMDDKMWKKLFIDMQFGDAPIECSEKCNSKKWSQEHATLW